MGIFVNHSNFEGNTGNKFFIQLFKENGIGRSWNKHLEKYFGLESVKVDAFFQSYILLDGSISY